MSKTKLDDVKDSAANALSDIKTRIKGMDKEKAKEALDDAKAKTKVALSEIKANFKADEGAEGVKKYQSMFVNLWKSGQTGKVALVAASVVVLFLFMSIFFGGSDDGGFDSSKSVDVDTLVMKGLYMRQSVEEAAKACRKIASSQSGLVAIDHHKGIEWDQKSPEFAEAMKKYEQWVETAKREVVLKADWLAHMDKRAEMGSKGLGREKLEKMGLKNYTYDEYKKEFYKTCNPERADAAKVEEWLKDKEHFKPSKYKEAPKNLIEIIAENIGSEKNVCLCKVSLDKDYKVSQVFFTEQGMARIFNAGDLSSEEFAQAIVKNYPDIPSLEADVKIDSERSTDEMTFRNYTWTYKDPRGFKVKILDGGFYDGYGQRINMKRYGKMQNETGIAASVLASHEAKWFAIMAIKPESARQFD